MKRGPYKSTPPDGTVAALIMAFRQSPRYLRWAASTRRQNDRKLGDFMAFNGHRMVAELSRGDFLRLRDSMAATPGAAGNWMKVINAILDYAVDLEWIVANPAKGIHGLPPNHPGGFRTWREDEIEAYRAHWPIGSTPRLVFELALGTAASPVDLVKLGWPNVHGAPERGDAPINFHAEKLGYGNDGKRDFQRGGSDRDLCSAPQPLARIAYRRQKTERRKGAEETPMVDIPILPDLAEALAVVPRDRLTFLEEDGHPCSQGALAHRVRRWVAEAGLGAPDRYGRHLTPHGLRKAMGRRLAEAGASPHVIMAILGHESIASGQVYTKAYDRARAADMGAELLGGAKPSNVKRLRKQE